MAQEVKVNTKDIITRLARLQAYMNYIREHIDDKTLTEDDIKSIEEAEKEHKEGKTTSLEKLKKELDL